MLYIKNECLEPYFNVALEEYFMKNFKDECFILWRNKPTVLIGKNQNALSEINQEFVKEKNIFIVRRVSGGGAVFQDLGNLNFTFITNDSTSINNFKKFTKPVRDALLEMGINSEFSGRNDILVDGKKISGNAQYKYKNRVLHHGTLLFSSKGEDISKALNVKEIKLKSKGVKSVKSRVTNIQEHLPEWNNNMSVLEFRDTLANHILKLQDSKEYILTKEDIRGIDKLAKEKYSTWEWNFGSSPDFNYNRTGRYEGGTLEVSMFVHKGIIKDIKISGDFFGEKELNKIEEKLNGIEYERVKVNEILNNFNLNEYMFNIRRENLIECMGL